MGMEATMASDRWRRMERAWRRLGSIALLLAIALPARAGLPETPMPRQLSVADGLPSNTVYDVAEDADGYLWFATLDGLARYDGIGLRVWRREDGLGDNEIDCVYVDRDNRVWAGTDTAGLVELDAGRRRFVRHDRIGDVRLSASPIWDVLHTADGALWIGTSGAGLYRWRRDGRIEQFLPDAADPASLPGRVVTALELAPDGSLWVATNAGVARWTGRGFARVPVQALLAEYVQGLVFGRDGALWVRSIPGGSVYRGDGSWSWHPLRIAGDPMVFGPLLRDHEGAFWTATSQGLTHVDEDGSYVVPLYSNLTRGAVRPQFERALAGRDGGLWFTTQDAGVWHLPSNWRQLSVLFKQDAWSKTAAGANQLPMVLGNAQVYGIAASAGGSMWLVGTSGVLDELDPESGAVRHVFTSRPQRVLTAVFESADGKVWVGFGDGLGRYDPATGRWREWTAGAGADAAFPGDLTAITQDRAGLLWTWSLDEGMQARTTDGRVVERIAPGAGRGLEALLTVSQLRDGPDGQAWVAGSTGLLAWSPGARRFVPVAGVTAGPANGFGMAGDGSLWVARTGAVEQYRAGPQGWRRVRRIGAEAGMPQIGFRGLTIDHRDVLWLGSIRGLLRVDPATAATRLYGLGDGLPGQEILVPPVPRARDGRLVAAASHGLVVFDPVVVRPSREVPRLSIDAVTVGHGADAIELPVAAGFEIGHDDRDLRVVARLMSFDNVAGNRYRFRLSGFDDGWVDAGAGGERTFSRLPPGHYRLEVAGRTADGVWSPVRTLAFRVRPPWWLGAWAIALYAVAGVLLGAWAVLGYRERLRRRSAWQLAEHKRELAEQASQAKTRFLATLGHEVRTPMTGVLGMSELLLGTQLDMRQRGYVQSIRNAGQHLLRLVNDALDLARIEAGKLELDLQDFDVRELVAGVAALVAPAARQRGLALGVDIADDVPHALHGDALRVRQILLNLLNNAIKFTEHGRVDLRARAGAGGGVHFEVADTGPGIGAEQRARLFRRFEQGEGPRTAARYGGSGLGLAICQELALAMGGRIDVDSAPGKGSCFAVELPLAPALGAVTPAAEAAAAPAAAVPPGLRILLVEDDATVADVVTGLLRQRGHHVVHAAHGLAALTEAAAADFDVGLLDLDLPGLDGFALARQLRGLGFAAPLLAVTARADGEAEAQAKTAGFDGFLRKPVTGDLLAAAIAAVLPAAEKGE